MRVRLPPTSHVVTRRLGFWAAIYVTAQFALTGVTLVAEPRVMAWVWFGCGLGLGAAAMYFEVVKERRRR